MMAADAAVGPTDRPRPTLAPHTAIRSYNDNGQKNREQLRRGTSARSPSANLCGPLDLESKLVRRLVGSFIGETEHNKYIHRRRPSLFFLSFYISGCGANSAIVTISRNRVGGQRSVRGVEWTDTSGPIPVESSRPPTPTFVRPPRSAPSPSSIWRVIAPAIFPSPTDFLRFRTTVDAPAWDITQ